MKLLKNYLEFSIENIAKLSIFLKKIQNFFRKFRNSVRKFRRIYKNQQFNCFD